MKNIPINLILLIVISGLFLAYDQRQQARAKERQDTLFQLLDSDMSSITGDTTLTFSKNAQTQTVKMPPGHRDIELVLSPDGFLLDVRVIGFSGIEIGAFPQPTTQTNAQREDTRKDPQTN